MKGGPVAETLRVFIDEASEGGPLTCCTLAWS